MGREMIMICFLLLTVSGYALETDLKLYRPFVKEQIHTQPVIVEKQVGVCVSQSYLIKREDAWHCITNGQILDPCFIQRFESPLQVICVSTPWSEKAIQLLLASPLDFAQHESLDMSKTLPWAIELINGIKCYAVEVKKFYDNLPVRYECEQNQVLIGHVQRCENPWKILRVVNDAVDIVQIKRVWF